jgi:hypothetical protein
MVFTLPLFMDLSFRHPGRISMALLLWNWDYHCTENACRGITRVWVAIYCSSFEDGVIFEGTHYSIR